MDAVVVEDRMDAVGHRLDQRPKEVAGSPVQDQTSRSALGWLAAATSEDVYAAQTSTREMRHVAQTACPHCLCRIVVSHFATSMPVKPQR